MRFDSELDIIGFLVIILTALDLAGVGFTGIVEHPLFEAGDVEHLHFDDIPLALFIAGADVQIGVFHPLDFGGQVGIEQGKIDDPVRRLQPQNGVEEAQQNILTALGAEDAFESKVGFGIEEVHG